MTRTSSRNAIAEWRCPARLKQAEESVEPADQGQAIGNLQIAQMTTKPLVPRSRTKTKTMLTAMAGPVALPAAPVGVARQARAAAGPATVVPAAVRVVQVLATQVRAVEVGAAAADNNRPATEARQQEQAAD